MRTKAVAVVVAVASVALLGVSSYVYFSGAAEKDDTYTVTAYFDKAIGLFSESAVSVLGVPIGEVMSVTPEGQRVKVVMSIESERKVPADATAFIVPISLISDRYIQLSPPYESGPILKDGDVLDVDRTSIPVELDDVLSSLKKFLEAVEAGTASDPGALGAAVKNLANALEGAGSDIDATLGGAGKVSEVIVSESAHLDSIVVRLSSLMSALAEKQTEITQVNTRMAQALGAIADEKASLEGVLSNLAVVTEQLGGIIRDNRPTLEQDLVILTNTTQAALRHQDSLIRANDWLHVLADGAEESHNGGVVHTFEGVTHLDVRDEHGGSPALCTPPLNLLTCPPPISAPASTSSGASAAAGAPVVDEPQAPGGGSPKPLAIEQPSADKHSSSARITKWFVSLGRWIDSVFGGGR